VYSAGYYGFAATRLASMDARLTEFLRRLGEAEAVLKRMGEERQPFLLIYASGGSIGIKHPGWDPSWMQPTAEDVDDLEELGFVRNEPPTNVKRVFTLTFRGRQQAEAIANRAAAPTGRAPNLDETLQWLKELEGQLPAALLEPGDLPSRAVNSGLISPDSEELLAQRIIDLLSQGFLEGDAPGFDQAGPMQRLQLSDGLRLTMKAHDRLKEKTQSASSINFYGSVVAGQIAAGDINNFVSFSDLLDRAEAEIRALEDVDGNDRDEALTLIDALRGKAAGASVQVLTGAGGGLLADVLARLIGLSPPI
jgi:hypothetical protein